MTAAGFTGSLIKTKRNNQIKLFWHVNRRQNTEVNHMWEDIEARQTENHYVKVKQLDNK